MKIADLQKIFVDADHAAEHASVLWDASLEEAYAALRDAAASCLTSLGQERTVARLRSTLNHTTTKQ